MLVPQAVTAIGASLLGATWSRRVGTRRVYLLGLVTNIAAMALLLVSSFVEDETSLAYALLLLATASLGIGFGLTVRRSTRSPRRTTRRPSTGRRPEPVSLHPQPAA